MQPKEAIEKILKEIDASEDVKQQYVNRLAEGNIVRDENQISHFCSYFLPYRLSDKKVFLEAHKKSGLWLSPGGHIDPGETPGEAAEREMKEELEIEQLVDEAKLLTVTHIKRDVRFCAVHYDIWYFVPVDDRILPTRKEGEFDDARWFTLDEAKKVLVDENNLKALNFVEKNIFV